MFKSLMDKIGKLYITRQVNKKILPDFTLSNITRIYVIFKGEVQGVGFRFEILKLARRLGLTGFVKNLENSDVEAEIQGEEDKVNYLIEEMKSHKRIKIESIETSKKEISDKELDFIIKR